MKTFKSWLATKAFDWLDKNQPAEMQRRIRAHVDKIVPDVTMGTVMAYLDQQHLLHCGACPTRHGLHRVSIQNREVYLCDRDYKTWQSQKMMAEANNK